MANRELNVVLGIKLNEFEKGLMNAQKKMERFAQNAQKLGQTLTTNLTLPILGAGTASVAAFIELERLEKGLAAVMGSSEAAAIELRNLQEVAKLPGLGFEEAVQGSIRLQSVGLSANEARETLSAFGAAIAATGGTAQNLESVQYQLTQMISKNRILQEDFGIIQENVPLVGKAIEAAFGTRNVEQIRKSGVNATEFNRRLVEQLKILPEVQNVAGGLGNAFENFGDSVKVSFAELGRSINTALNLEGVLDGLANVVQNVVDYFKGLSPEAQRFIVISAAVVAAIGPMMFIFGQIIAIGSKVISVIRGIGAAFTFMLSPIGLTIAAITAIVAGIVLAYNEFEGFRRVVNGVIEVIQELFKIFKEGATAFFQGFASLKEGNFRDAAKNFGEAIKKLNPVGVAFTQGKRLGNAFTEGYADSTNRLTGVYQSLKNLAQGKGITNIEGGGDDTKDKTKPPLDPSFERMKNFKPIEIIKPETPLILQQTNTQIQQNTQAISDYKEMIAAASIAIENQTLAQERANKENRIGFAVMESMQAISNTLVDSFFSALESGQNVIKSLIGGLKQLVIQLAKTIAKAVIFAGIMALIPGGSLIGQSISGLGGLVGKGSFLKNLLGGALPFANGGLVTGPTLGLIGEGSGTSMSNPEVVAPLDKLKSILDSSMGGGQFVASTRLQGSDLLLIVERAERNRGR